MCYGAEVLKSENQDQAEDEGWSLAKYFKLHLHPQSMNSQEKLKLHRKYPGSSHWGYLLIAGVCSIATWRLTSYSLHRFPVIFIAADSILLREPHYRRSCSVEETQSKHDDYPDSSQRMGNA